MERTIPKKDALLRPKLQLTTIIRTQVRPTSTTKHLEEGVVRELIQQEFKRRFHVEETCRKSVYEKTGCGKSITPKPKR
jgi:hypothetical protein